MGQHQSNRFHTIARRMVPWWRSYRGVESPTDSFAADAWSRFQVVHGKQWLMLWRRLLCTRCERGRFSLLHRGACVSVVIWEWARKERTGGIRRVVTATICRWRRRKIRGARYLVLGVVFCWDCETVCMLLHTTTKSAFLIQRSNLAIPKWDFRKKYTLKT